MGQIVHARDGATETFEVCVVVALAPRSVSEVVIRLFPGTTVGAALKSPELAAVVPLDHSKLHLSVWGRKALGSDLVRANDRIELCRPLTVDPKVARRERFAHQGAKKAGLFKVRRPGGRAGY